MKAGRFRLVLRQRSLLWALTLRDFRGKYVGSMMGLFWSLINPLLMLFVFTFVFTVIFQIRLGTKPGFSHNAVYIFCGVLPWLAFQEAVQRSATALIEQKNLVTRVRFPSAMLPASIVGSSALGMMTGMVVLLGAVLLVTGRMPVYALFLPVIIALQIVFTLGLALFVSSVNIFFRDLQHLLPVGLLVWMYGTPIFYSPEMVMNAGDFTVLGRTIGPRFFSMTLKLNPIHHLIAAYRSLLLDGRMPTAESMFYLAGFSVLSLAVGALAFARGRPKFADVL